MVGKLLVPCYRYMAVLAPSISAKYRDDLDLVRHGEEGGEGGQDSQAFIDQGRGGEGRGDPWRGTEQGCEVITVHSTLSFSHGYESNPRHIFLAIWLYGTRRTRTTMKAGTVGSRLTRKQKQGTGRA